MNIHRIEPESFLNKFIACPSSAREALLETSSDLENKYQKAALRGNTSPPSAQDEVDLTLHMLHQVFNRIDLRNGRRCKGTYQDRYHINRK